MIETSKPLAKGLAPVLMVVGTSSHAGKSTLVAALCRLFARAGYRVAPFKAQNMSNNAAVTGDGGEVGRAQAMQAMAAGISVTVDMNPVLLKPQSDRTSQVVVLGKARHQHNAREYYDRTKELWPIVSGALDRLRAEYDVIVAEGAGSPAEINLDRYDIVNMRVARYAHAPTLLVGDIDRGGVFASLYGTVALLAKQDRALIRGFVINRFRGDPSLLDPGFIMLEDRTGIPTFGVLPYLDLSGIPAEDALEWEERRSVANHDGAIDVAILRLPRVANLDEFQPLIAESGVSVRWITSPSELADPDLIIVPGTKSTMDDLEWLRDRGLIDAIRERHANGTPVLGICGGFQMLGLELVDDAGVERAGRMLGLGLLPVTTTFHPEKVTRRVTAAVSADTALWSSLDSPGTFDGYEIHVGRTVSTDTIAAAFSIAGRAEGCVSPDGLVVGTHMHGLLENARLRRAMLARLAARKGRALPEGPAPVTPDQALDALANSVAEHLNLDAIARLVGRPLGAAR